MTFQVRQPRPDEAEAFRRLGQEAFGMPAQPPTGAASVQDPGAAFLGVYDEDAGGVLAGRLVDRAFDSWIGGRLVPTCGVAGVTVAAEYRGRKLLDLMFEAMLAAARERGAVISTLHPSAPGIYRRFGFEVVGDLGRASTPSWPLAQLRPDPELITRRAVPSDVAGIRSVYDSWAAGQNGPLSRRGPSYAETDEQFLADFTGVSVAVDPTGAVCGFATWERGAASGPEAMLEVADLIADRPGAYRSLLAAVGSHSSVLGRVRFETSGLDLIRSFLPTAQWDPTETTPYMLAIIDVPGALRARGYGAAVRGELQFAVRSAAGSATSELDGCYRLSVADGFGVCEPSDTEPGDGPIFSPRGLALAYLGVSSTRALRATGLITGPDQDDAQIDSLFAGCPFAIKDHF